jgi:hypothetical protein
MIAIGAQAATAAAAHASNSEGWLQAGELGLALSAAIGLEREIRQKNAAHPDTAISQCERAGGRAG